MSGGVTDEVSVKVSADVSDFDGGVRKTVSGLDAMAESSGRLKDALASTNAISHDVDALFKQITTSSKSMGEAAEALNRHFREGIIPVSDLNALSERLRGHFSGLGTAAREAGAAIREVGTGASALTAVNDNAREAAASMEKVGHMTVGARRELIVLAHEAMSGNFARMPGSLMVLAERFGTVGMAALRVAWPLAAVGFVAYEVAAHAEAAAQALARTQAALTLSGQAGLFTREGLEATVSQLALMHGVSKEAAEGVVAEFARIRSVTPGLMSDLSRGMEGWVALTGEEAPAAARKLAQSIADPEKFLGDLDKQTNAVSADTKQLVQDLMDSGQVMEAKAVAAREFGDVMERTADQIKTPFQRAAQEAANALSHLADVFGATGEKGEGLAVAMRTLAEVIRHLELPVAVLGKALRDLLDIISMGVQGAMINFTAMKTVVEMVALAVVDFARAVKQALTGDIAEAQKTALDMPRKLAEAWGVGAAEVKRHLDEIRASMRDVAEPYLPGHKAEHQDGQAEGERGKGPGGPDGENANDRDKRVLEILNATLTVQRELRQIEGEKMALKEQMALLENQMAAASDKDKGKIQAQIAEIKEALKVEDERAQALRKKDGGESAMEGYRRQLADIQAADKRSLDERKAEDLRFWQDKRANHAEGSKEFAQISLEISRLEKAIDADTHNARLANLERLRAAAHKGSEERITLARQEAEEVKKYAGEHSRAYEDALKRVEEMQKEHQKELDRISAEGTEARASAQKADLAVETENLRFLRDMGVLGEQDQLARLREIKAQEYEIERDALQKKLALQSLEATERDRINKQITQLDQTFRAQDLAASHQQTVAVLREWQTAASGMGSAFSTAFHGMAFQGQRLAQAERSAALSILGSWTDLAGKKIGTWIWSEGVMRAWSRMVGQQEVVDAAQKEAAKTGAVTMGQAARTAATAQGSAARGAAEATEHAGFLGRVAEQIAQWLGLETSKTTETTTESVARSTAVSASALAAIVAAKAEAAGEIPAYASIAAAAAMASVAAIPFVGWAMAPEVGEETFAEAMSFLPMASAAGGWDEVPKDGVVTELHKKEMVLSADIADPLRRMLKTGSLADAGADAMAFPALKDPADTNAPSRTNSDVQSMRSLGRGRGSGGGDTHIHNHITSPDAASVANLFTRNGSALVTALNRQVGLGAKIKVG